MTKMEDGDENIDWRVIAGKLQSELRDEKFKTQYLLRSIYTLAEMAKMDIPSGDFRMVVDNAEWYLGFTPSQRAQYEEERNARMAIDDEAQRD